MNPPATYTWYILSPFTITHRWDQWICELHHSGRFIFSGRRPGQWATFDTLSHLDAPHWWGEEGAPCPSL